MRLQSNLHLPTRQRNDGHHETPTFRRTPPSVVAVPALILCASTSAILLPGTAQAEPKPVGTWGWTTGSATYIRIRPGTQTPAVAKVPLRTKLMVWGTYDGWYRVETTDNKFGWIYNDYVKVPKADKLIELSHAKAKKASDSTGNQTLYGTPEQLKQYYARYNASGALRGLEKQGVRITSNAKKPAAQKAAAKPVATKKVKPVVRRVVTPNVKADAAKTTVVSVSGSATAQKTTSTPVVASTTPNIPAPKPRPASVSQKSAPAARKPKTQIAKSPQVAPMPPSQLPSITAEDIMSARAEHMRTLPARHRTRPYVAPKKPAEKPATEATVQSSSAETAGGADVTPASYGISLTPLKDARPSTATPMSSEPFYIASAKKVPPAKNDKKISRGGSPRDAAAWAKKNNRFGNGMAKQALSYRGMPYIRGASNPRRGFDCSGLVYYLLRQRGYNPPRTAAGMAKFGKPVAKSALKPGDIVFFANTYKRGVSHVGIYVGNNNFVHAANSGSGVKTDSLSSAYYRKKYWGARRIK